jgi:hypothetical protein
MLVSYEEINGNEFGMKNTNEFVVQKNHAILEFPARHFKKTAQSIHPKTYNINET